MSKLSEKYYVLCKKADARVKNIQTLLVEWQKLDEILEPKKPAAMDDLQVKQFVTFSYSDQDHLRKTNLGRKRIPLKCF